MSDILRGGLDVLLLGLLDRKPDHGYGLMVRLRDLGEHEASDGAIYPALARLEAAGKIEGKWSTGDAGRRRKIFQLSEKGRNQLRATRKELPGFVARLTSILGGSSA